MLVSRPCGTESLGHRARSEFRIRYEIVKAGRPWTTRGAEEGPSSTGALSSFKPTLHIVRKQRAVSAESRKLLGVPGARFFCTDKRAPRGSARDTGWAMSEENVELLHRAYDAFNGATSLHSSLFVTATWSSSRTGWRWKGAAPIVATAASEGGGRAFAVYPDFTGEIEAVLHRRDRGGTRACGPDASPVVHSRSRRQAATRRWIRSSGRLRASATERSFGGAFGAARPRPSKPSGCRSRRCRRRTWRPRARSLNGAAGPGGGRSEVPRWSSPFSRLDGPAPSGGVQLGLALEQRWSGGQVRAHGEVRGRDRGSS